MQPDVDAQRPPDPRPPDVPAAPAVLGYSRPSPDEFLETYPWLVVKLLGGPVVLSVVAGYVVASATQDADPFGDTSRQSLLYAGLSPLLILSWIGWAGWVLVGVLRRRFPVLVALPLALLAVWGALVSTALYSTTSEFVEQTTRFHVARWPILEKIFRP